MTEKAPPLFEKCSFFTQYFLAGWKDEKTPIWEELMKHKFGSSEPPVWHDWAGNREKWILPLSTLAKRATLFGMEWRVDRPEFAALKTFVESRFRMEKRRMVCDGPVELADNPLFWLGGHGVFELIPVLSFEIDALDAVLESLRCHNQAGKNSPRYGTPFTNINKFAKSVAENGGFAAIIYGGEAELFYPIALRDRVKQVADEVEAHAASERLIVRLKTQGPQAA